MYPFVLRRMKSTKKVPNCSVRRVSLCELKVLSSSENRFWRNSEELSDGVITISNSLSKKKKILSSPSNPFVPEGALPEENSVNDGWLLETKGGVHTEIQERTFRGKPKKKPGLLRDKYNLKTGGQWWKLTSYKLVLVQFLTIIAQRTVKKWSVNVFKWLPSQGTMRNFCERGRTLSLLLYLLIVSVSSMTPNKI